jgi:hypothetical protein
MFRWTYFREAYGNKSNEFAQALVDGKNFNPFGRYSYEAEFIEDIENLKLWELYEAFFGHNNPVKWTTIQGTSKRKR